ncbi:hypothetical protein OS493_031240 [Desmophyllum pertusum]|uniref:Uncharacterized protein n=1 Tax=Desmophyllum pertusum TaxID=174260 RepID=A0A9W9Z851_9CNID|nr:hypothetical protein OS493_031240 [Desmophyllum pertusum]
MGSGQSGSTFLKLLTCVSLSTLCCVQGQKRKSPNQEKSLSTAFVDNLSSTTHSELPQNSGQLHGGIIAFILLGCIMFLVLLGLFLTVVYLRKRNSEQDPLKWEKNFEESMGSFEMLDPREMDKLSVPTGRSGRADMNLSRKREQESIV